MRMRIEDKTLPITYEGCDWDEACTPIQLYDVEFLKDFGVFKKGDKVYSLFLYSKEGVLREYDTNGNVKREVNIKYVPV